MLSCCHYELPVVWFGVNISLFVAAWATNTEDLWTIFAQKMVEWEIGRQWRAWPGRDGETIDQISNVLHSIRTNPDSRRHMVVAYNPTFVDEMALPPCHAMFQFHVAEGRLSCQLYQRSADTFLGVPFNIASYALLTHMVAQQCELAVGDFIWTGGDVHIYRNHLDQVQTQLSREPLSLPKLEILRHPPSLFDYAYEDFTITGYQSHPHIAAPIAV